MRKTGSKLKNLLYAIPIAIASFLPGCEKENYPPEANLEVSPISGEVPLNVRMKVTGEDPDGIQDITQYILNIGGESVRSKTPIDITKTFENTGKIDIYGEVIDSKNHMDKTGISSVEVYRGPYLEQSASLNNDVEINYSATLYKVNNAELKVNREGVLFKTEEIKDSVETGVDYQKTFNYANDRVTKGNYEFVLKSDNLEKKNNVSIPNYKPTITSIAPVNFLEETDSTIILPTPTDKNPEDIANIAYTKATSLDGKTEVTLLTENKLKIKGLPNQIGNYQIEIEYGSTSGGLEKSVLTGNIIEDTRLIINPFVQPNDSTLNWYGSGDVNNDNSVNSGDLTKLSELINGTYSNPNDKRLNDRADINGDGNVNNQDKQILENKLNGSLLYLPGEWNKLRTRAEREDWLAKMVAIDKPDKRVFPGGNCVQHDQQALINFHGVSLTDIPKFLNVYPYDFSDNGRFNMPLLEIIIGYYDSEGNVLGGHAMNTIILGDNAKTWESLCNVEPQFAHINVQPGEDYLDGKNSTFSIRGPPTISGNGFVEMQTYFGYFIKNNIPTLNLVNTNLNIITERGK